MDLKQQIAWYDLRLRYFENRYGRFSEKDLKPLTPFQKWVARFLGICLPSDKPLYPELDPDRHKEI